MSSKKGGGGRVYSGGPPRMGKKGGAGGGKQHKGGRGAGKPPTPAASSTTSAPAGRGKKRVRAGRALNAYAHDSDDEGGAEDLGRYGDAALSREYRLPDSFQDEELGSDDEGVWDEADEAKWGDVFAARKRNATGGKGKRSTASTDDDDAGEDEEGEGEEEEDLSGFEGAETMDLSAMLDMDAEEEEEEEERPKKGKGKKEQKSAKLTAAQQRLLLGEDEDEEDDGAAGGYHMRDDDEDALSVELDEDEDEEGNTDAHRNLLNFVSGLGAENDEDQPAAKRKKGATKTDKPLTAAQRAEAFEEDAFAAPRTDAEEGSRGLKIGDLLKRLPGEDGAPAGGANLAALRKQFAVLQQSHTSTLVEPLPEVRQEELTRAAAYEADKEEVARWAPIIQRHRDAPHLSFPLYEQPRQNANSAQLAATFVPSKDSSLERDLSSLLAQYALKPSALRASEERSLAERHYTAEEVERRQENLAKMKALLFAQELKAARMNRIKSKSYRRLRKRMREKAQMGAEELKHADPEAYEELQRKAEARRIEERMTQSHAHGSKWVAKQLRLAKESHGTNAAVKDALKDHQRVSSELREKMENFPRERNSDEDSSEQEEEEAQFELSDESDEEADAEKAADKAAAQETARLESIRSKLRALKAELDEGDESTSEPALGFDHPPGARPKPKSSDKLLGLKFMARAAQRQKEETKEMVRQYEEELAAEERRIERRRERRRQGLPSESEGEEDQAQDREQNEKDLASDGAKALSAGRRKLDSKHSASTVLATSSGDASVNLLPNSLQSASVGLGRGSRARVAEPISVALPKQSAASAAAAAGALPKTSAAHPGQHHSIHGKSSVPVDTPFISSAASEALFPVEDFSDDDEGEAKTAHLNATSVDMQKLQESARAQAAKAKKAAAQAVKAGSVGVAGGSAKNAANGKKGAKQEAESDDEDADLDAAAEAEEEEANPWAASAVVAANPRKALRDEEAAARKRKKAKTADSAVAADRPMLDDDEEQTEQLAREGGIDADLSGPLSLQSRRSEFDLLSSGSLSQAELVKRAFSVADEDRAEGAESEEDEFDRMKREAVEADLPKEETPVSGLPGWGSWGGLGAKNWKSPAQIAKEKAEARARQAKREAALAARADAKLSHVLINQKVDQKALKYQVASLPYPFTSAEQYEKSLATPVGREWNTSSAFAQNVKPRIITKAGEIIEPAKFNPKVGVAGKKDKGAKKISGSAGPNAAAGQKRKR